MSVLALARHQRGDLEEANTTFRRATKLITVIGEESPCAYDRDAQIAEILYLGAEYAITSTTTSVAEVNE